MAKKGSIIGSWSFLIGVVLAVVLGAVGSINQTITVALLILGLVIGLLNVTDKEVMPFLMAGTVLVIVSALGSSVLGAMPVVSRMLAAILTLFVPATIIVALKSVFSLARN
ncbi:MAG TPA: hypothetical protein VJJ53_02265 [Candidatus Nanoarchaeia archaeon]|nr:hypothetical protein [Candidatus Nanoarchaeia archaeon]